jgi:mannose/cellobiose epimerase-like protein (N-acyl-D-glucosamine 2-epimerase family)
MTDRVDPRAPGMGAVISIHDQLLGWLRERALPLWDTHGVDRVNGGYFESLSLDAETAPLITEPVRRGRVVARQIYAFDVGQRLGWCSARANPVEHGCSYLFAHLHGGDGVFHTAVHAESRQPVAPFSLYEHAFYLFALARLAGGAGESFAIRDTALRCLEQLRARLGRQSGGFEESTPPSLPLKSNPHMHLLEAALAWIEVSEGTARTPWIALAREIVGLCLTCFVDANTGAVGEYFDCDWRRAAGDSGRVVEPGHQFEWAWLLFEWVSTGLVEAAAREACVKTALRLMEVGERWGVDPVRDVAINEIWDDMSVKDSNAKIWPQTERLKAWCARLAFAVEPEEAALASRKVAAAARALWRYLCVEPAGLWHEVWSADGGFLPGPCKASSFYHVVCAIDVMRQTVARA